MERLDRIEEKLDNISNEISDIKRLVAVNTTKINQLILDVNGNGKKGILSRIRELEEWKWKTAGGLAIIVIILEFIMKLV